MIENILITSLICTLIHVSTYEGMINFWIRQFGDRYLPKWIRKPLYDCLTCMSLVIGGLILIGLSVASVHLNPVKIALSILAVGGLNSLIALYVQHHTQETPPASIGEPDSE